MKNLYWLRKFLRLTAALKYSRRMLRAKPITVALFLIVGGLAPFLVSQAQKTKDRAVNISSVSTQPSSGGTVVSISADGPLNHAQTWQDGEGYHVVVPYEGSQGAIKTAKGIKVRKVGKSLEILVQTKPGANVTVQPSDNHLNLAINGKLDSRANDPETTTEGKEGEGSRGAQPKQRREKDSEATQVWKNASSLPLSSTVSDLAPRSPSSSPSSSQSGYQPNVPSAQPNLSSSLISSHQKGGSQDGSSQENGEGETEIKIQQEEEGFFASVFSGTSVLIVLAVAILAFLVVRKVRSRQASTQAYEAVEDPDLISDDEGVEDFNQGLQHLPEHSAGNKSLSHASDNGSSKARKPGSHLVVATPDSLFGAYRIDQEVGKLVLGQPHRMDVLSSRAPDDRRAIETSLVKIISASPEDDERRRACDALEEYGFVARQCAALLLAQDAFDRTSAARSLGEIKSPAALPFLLEALYDHETIVRNQAVVSIGELRLPKAIGALLDMARQHPDVPASLVSRALSACSLEGLDFLDATISQPALLSDGRSDVSGHEITQLEPSSLVEDLPEASDDEMFAAALSQAESDDLTERLEAAKTLAQYSVASSVVVLSSLARLDAEAAIRAQAISSLSAINHESVFPAVLIGMADESREVRAAAARSLSRLSFDRADAYVRLIETADEELLQEVTRACNQAGLVAQAVDRLASSDRRQAYEAFSLVSLLANAKQTEPIIEAISRHNNMDVRLAAIRLLANSPQPEVFEQLRELAVEDGMVEEVRTALLEALYKLDQARTKDEETLAAPEVAFEHNFEFGEVPVQENFIENESHSEVETPVDEFEL